MRKMLITTDRMPTIEAAKGEGKCSRQGTERLEASVFEQQGRQTVPGIGQNETAGLLMEIQEALVEHAL